MIQEIYLGNKDALKKRFLDISHQIYQSTGRGTCLELDELSSCESLESPLDKLIEEKVLNSIIKIRLLPFVINGAYYNTSLLASSLIFLFFFIFTVFWNFKNILIPYLKSKEELEIQSQIKASNDQFSHDIKSPLISLEYVIESIVDKLTVDERMISRQSLERINDILLTLRTSQFDNFNDSNSEITIIYPIIKKIVAEKRVEYTKEDNFQIEINNQLSYGVSSNINKSLFSRSLSNIINNCIEARKRNTRLKIKINLENDKHNCYITISDNGIGLSEVKKSQIFNKGVSFNKINGKGLGLSEIKKYLLEIGGAINFESNCGKGSTVKISLNLSLQPEWLKANLSIPRSQKICIIDDDKSIHSIWRNKLFQYETLHFYNSSEFERWAKRQNKLEDFYYLFDLELIGSQFNGLELIQRYGINNISSLVTSHYNSKIVQGLSMEALTQIIPKESLMYITINDKSITHGLINPLLNLTNDKHLVTFPKQ